jgi:bifunctional non-homologous end joining protein LigD
MSLTAYNRKRNFRATPEPEGKSPRASKGTRALKFVIQKHDASRLHYDFRLEVDGVLKSWAVPKGPSLDPAKKSLAVQVEDHPLDYGEFEGVIPQAQYGGGTVMLWDRGTWEPLHDPADGLRKGKLHFALRGEKLAGEWSLVQMHGRSNEDGKNWLLMKLNDDAASKNDVLKNDRSVKSDRNLDEIADDRDRVWKSNRNGRTKKGQGSSSLPSTLSPQLATLANHAPTGDEWLHEVKFDGYRMLVFITGGEVRLLTRNGKDWTRKFPTIVRAFQKLDTTDTILDGELVVLDEDGVSDFQALQALIKDGEKAPLSMYLFDLPFAEGRDLRHEPLIDRKTRLKKLLDQSTAGPAIQYSDHAVGDGASVVKEACRMSLEGVISKRVNSPYVSRRSNDWLKSKCQQRQEFVVIGYTDPGGSRSHFGALLIGVHDEAGKLVYAGRVGTGFDERRLRDLHDQLTRLHRKSPPTDKPVPTREKRHAHWVEPKLVAEIRFTGWTREGVLRHPAFLALRSDKPAEEIVREKHSAPDAGPTPPRLSHPDKVLYPQQGLTKQNLADYYTLVAKRMFPHVADRPLALVRCPSGRSGKCFFQRNHTDTLPEAIVPIDVSDSKKKEEHVGIRSADGLSALVQVGVLEIHTWGSCRGDIEHPNQLIFDLDPADDVPWRQTVKIAKRLKSQLDSLKLPTFLKTSGGKGLHVVIPIEPTIDWDTAKSFCETIVKSMAADHPDEVVANMRKDLRKGKVYIDYHRNGRGATAVAPYSTRARADAPVSMPIDWSRLSRIRSAAQFTVKNVRSELKKTDPWRDFDRKRVDLKKVIGEQE